MKFKITIPNDNEPKIIIAPPALFGHVVNQFCIRMKIRGYQIARETEMATLEEIHNLIAEYNLYSEFTAEFLQEKYTITPWFQQGIQAFLQLKQYGNKTTFILPETHMHINYQEKWIETVFNKNIDCLILTYSPDLIGVHEDRVYSFEIVDREDPTMMELEIEEE